MNLVELLSSELQQHPRHTGYLHCSTHLTDIDRHILMDYYEYPRKPTTYGDYTRVQTGTLWHDHLRGILDPTGDMMEVPVTTGLPKGWTGTADLLWYDTLVDIKTTTKDKMGYLSLPNSTPYEKYVWQISAYYHALENMGYFLTEASILYIPIDGGEFILKPVDILPKQMVWDRMLDVSSMIAEFEGVLPAHPGYNYTLKTVKSRKVHELYQVPPYYAAWCPFVDCPCGSMTKQIVASLSFSDEYEGDPKYRPILESKLV